MSLLIHDPLLTMILLGIRNPAIVGSALNMNDNEPDNNTESTDIAGANKTDLMTNGTLSDNISF